MIKSDFTFKFKKLGALIKSLNVDALFLFSSINRLWLTNVKVDDAFCFVTAKDVYFYTDARNFSAIKKQLDPSIHLCMYHDVNDLINFVKQHKIKLIAIENDYLKLNEYQKYIKPLGIESLSIDTSFIRIIKTDHEIKLMQKAADIAVNALNEVKSWIKIGMNEIEVKTHIHQYMIQNGASNVSFDLIVAFGKNTANPHHISNETILKNNSLVLIDIGCIYKGYCSDLTRTFYIGNKKPNKKIEHMYQLILEAQYLGLKNAQANIAGKILDVIVRKFIYKDKIFGKCFTHGLGHGVGIEIHEAPYISPTYHELVPANSVITIEPGVYLEGFGGVRIEDSVVITQNKPINLTINADKNFWLRNK